MSIRVALQTSVPVSHTRLRSNNGALSSFKPVSEGDIRILNSSPKKPNLDRNHLKNYRPVSHLSFISKLIAEVAAKQLNSYIDSEGFSNIISSFNITHHLYADYTQIYLALDHRNFDSSFAEFTECLTCIQMWMAGVKLKHNPEKTVFIIIGDRQTKRSLIQKCPTQLLRNSPLSIQSKT